MENTGNTNVGGTYGNWSDVYVHTAQVAVAILLAGTIGLGWRIQSRTSHNPNSEAGLIKWANLFMLLSFLSTAIAFWFVNVWSHVFGYVVFQETGNALYIFGWMFLARGITAINNPEFHGKKTPWHIIIGIIAIAIAAIWTLILSVDN